MNPHQRNKIDLSSMTEEEQKLFRLYGKLPNTKKLLNSKLQERKFFDSGDYALSKAGKSSPQSVGTAIPSPETIPHHKHGLANEIGVGSPISPAPTFVSTAPASDPVLAAEAAGLGTSPTHGSNLREVTNESNLGEDKEEEVKA